MRKALVLILLVPLTVLAAEIVRTFDAPDTAVSGLACTETQLWAVSATNSLYSIDPETGEILDSWYVPTTGGAPDGIGLAGSLLYITNGTSNVYKYTTGGVSQGQTSLYCAG